MAGPDAEQRDHQEKDHGFRGQTPKSRMRTTVHHLIRTRMDGGRTWIHMACTRERERGEGKQEKAGEVGASKRRQGREDATWADSIQANSIWQTPNPETLNPVT